VITFVIRKSIYRCWCNYCRDSLSDNLTGTNRTWKLFTFTTSQQLYIFNGDNRRGRFAGRIYFSRHNVGPFYLLCTSLPVLIWHSLTTLECIYSLCSSISIKHHYMEEQTGGAHRTCPRWCSNRNVSLLARHCDWKELQELYACNTLDVGVCTAAWHPEWIRVRSVGGWKCARSVPLG
jgi:hypothetical protein